MGKGPYDIRMPTEESIISKMCKGVCVIKISLFLCKDSNGGDGTTYVCKSYGGAISS